MRVGIYGIKFDDSFIPNIQQLFNILEQYGWAATIYKPFTKFLSSRVNLGEKVQTFSNHKELKEKVDMLFCIGGDGTFLETILVVRDSGIPVLGINTGRLGFLANTNRDEIEGAMRDLKDHKYRLQSRSLLTLVTENNLFGEENFALNELTVHKKDSASMISIHTYIGDLFLNSYWADGLIISTPTGSTAYSLSCGGPIMVPGVRDYVITPIAPHNLNVRPVVVPDDRIIKLKVEGRGRDYLCSLDSRSVAIDSAVELTIKRAAFEINVVQTEGQDFLSTMRNKMTWGVDKRN